jgi:hypothetical protein
MTEFEEKMLRAQLETNDLLGEFLEAVKLAFPPPTLRETVLRAINPK